MPAKVYTDESVIDVATLNDRIEKIDITSAITIYNALVANKTEIPDDVKQNLLELVTFYNETESLPAEYFEERDHTYSVMRNRDYQAPQWKNGGFAERLYASIEPKTTAAYNTMIRALIKFNKAQQANALFEEILAKDVPIDTATYNAIIESQSRMLASLDERWPSVEKLLRLMNERKVPPNGQTMNAILEVIRNGGVYRVQREKALNVLAEFKALNIEPSIGTWSIVVKIFCKANIPTSHILIDILDHLGDSEFKCQQQIDTAFFMTAMSVCYYHLNDFEMAKRVDRLLHIGENYKLIGDSYAQRTYYRNYVQLALKSLPLSESIEILDDIVPNVYSLEVNTCELFIGKINESGLIEYMPKLWSDILIADLITHRNHKMLENCLDVMCDNPPQSDLPAHANLNERFGESAWNYWQKISFEVSLERVTSVSATTLGKLLLLCCRHKQFERATEIFDAISVGTRKGIVTGATKYEPLKAFVELSIAMKQPTLAFAALEYAVERSFDESVQLGKLITENFTLNEGDMRKITNLVGSNVRTEKRRL